MTGLSAEIVNAILHLLPGFIAAWIFYGLTGFAKPSQFERVVQALILTALIQFGVAIVKWCLHGLASSGANFGPWTDDVRFGWSVVIAVMLGALSSRWANTDWLHGKLRRLRFTKHTSYPSAWYGALVEGGSYVVLHLCDGGVLYGWPLEWPNEQDSGHFVIGDAEWLVQDSSGSYIRCPADRAYKVLIAGRSVSWIELVEYPAE